MLKENPPIISSPWTAFLPSLAFNKFSIFCLNLLLPPVEISDDLSFLPKLGFLNLIFFKLSRKLNFVFLSSWFSFKFWFTSTGSFFSGCIVVWFWTGVPWTSVDWSVEVCICSWEVCVCSWEVCVCSWEDCFSKFCFSFSFCWWTSSNHFSNIGIASSRFGVPD